MKETLHQRMFEGGAYKSLPEHIALYEALEASMKRANRDEFFAEKDKSRKRRRDDQDPHLPPPDSDPNDTARTTALSISKLKATNYPDFGIEELVPSLWIESERDYDISAAYDITHWWFKHKDFYITKHNAPSNRRAVRSHMRILSVISIKTFERYGHAFLKEIIIRRADYNEYKIYEADFKNLHPNDFKDLDRNDQKRMLRENEVHKFSDGTLTRVLYKLDHMVKDFRLYQYNPSKEYIIWSEDDKRRSEEFMELIERRLKIQRIF
nr:hypothetical protein [Tanacetum cinerariifolium]